MNVYAFYLPQFHRTEENDKWWGEGFTDWVSCRNSSPLFDNHYQPHIPMMGYYDLLDKNTLVCQSKLMKEYGVDGLCFYHYWFGNGEMALDKPIANLLKWKDIDISYCFYWDVGSWVRSWSGLLGNSWIGNDIKEDSDKTRGVLFDFIEGREYEWTRHFEYLLPFFNDERYIKVDGKPLFMIHNPMDLGCLNSMINYWNELATKNGLKGIFYIGNGGVNRKLDCLDGILYHEPHNVLKSLTSYMNDGVKCYDYNDATEGITDYPYINNKKIYYSCFTGYDDTPRKGKQALVFENSTTENFSNQLLEVMARNYLCGNDITFVNAWNEWGEGMHLEPDTKYGFGYLEQVKVVKENYKNYAHCKNVNFETQNDSDDLKYELYFITLNRWLQNIGMGNSNIFSLLEKDKCRRIIIYGKSVFCEHLVTAANSNESVEIVGLIDQRNVSAINEIRTFQLGDKLPKHDAIVVASFYYYNDIIKELKTCYGNDDRIYSVEELVCNMQK